MADETSIANLALAKLGISPIMALTDDSKQAQFANRFYAQTRDEVLSSHRWNFAMRRDTLNRLATGPDFEWAFAYQLPTDCLRVVQLNGYEPNEQQGAFAIESDQLLTDAEEARALIEEYEALTGPKARMADVFEEQRRLKPAWVDSDLIKARFTRYPY